MKCILCQSSEDDEVLYGDMKTKFKLSVHTHCLYLSSNLSQNGSTEEEEEEEAERGKSSGIYGFLKKDIEAESRRVSKLKCCYCGKYYANIGCCEIKCRRSFHFICGIRNGAENQYIHTFKSFCDRHVRKLKQKPDPNEECRICYDELCTETEAFHPLKVLAAPCCNNGWFHKICLQRFAKYSGYFFKCPLCNDTNNFRNKLAFRGIFIPNQDAAWELEPNAFLELLERPTNCIANNCLSKTRTYKNDKNPLIYCDTCGSVAMHKLCLPSPDKSQFTCEDCMPSLASDSGREILEHRDMDERSASENEIDIEKCSDDEMDSASSEINSIEELNNIRKNTFCLKPRGHTIRSSCSSNSTTEIHSENTECDKESVFKSTTHTTKPFVQHFIEEIDLSSSASNISNNIDDEDDDPLENFMEHLARKLSQSSKFEDRSDCFHQQSSLDVSCIAKRTRRKSLLKNNNTSNTSNHEEFQSKPKYKNKMIYDACTDNSSSSTDGESSSSYYTAKSAITNNGKHDEKEGSVNVSCIASRTRKRRSFLAEDVSSFHTLNENESKMGLYANCYKQTNKFNSKDVKYPFFSKRSKNPFISPTYIRVNGKLKRVYDPPDMLQATLTTHSPARSTYKNSYNYLVGSRKTNCN